MGQIEHNSQDGILPLKTVTITLNAKCLNVKIKRQRFSNWIKKQYPTIKLSIRNPTQAQFPPSQWCPAGLSSPGATEPCR